MSQDPTLGGVGWLDLTVEHADAMRDFYADVVGWTPNGVPMGEGTYEDYSMQTAEGADVAGVCFRRGENAGLPPVWIPYFVVDDLSARVERAVAAGAELIHDRRGAQGGGFAVFQDPAGATFALYGVAPNPDRAFTPAG